MNRVLVLGGGQLGLMMAEAAARLGLVVDRYDPERALLLPGTSDLAVPVTWEECLERYPVVTVEREAFPDSGLSARLAASDRCVARGALAVIPDRQTQKAMLDDLGIATAPWRNLDQVEDLAAAAAEFGGVVVK
ncbi:MAG: phosphoribosylaminoimidazole carboxylase, partial [Alloalcanivorax venustensis]